MFSRSPATAPRSTLAVEGAVCRIDEKGQVRCDFGAPKRSRVVSTPADGKPTGLPPGCAVDLATGRWACPGHAVDGTDAKIKRVFTDETGHNWAVAGEAEVVVPALRAVAVGARSAGGREVFWAPSFQPTTNRSSNMNPQEQQAMMAWNAQRQQALSVGACGPMANPGLPAPPYPGMGNALGCAPLPLAPNVVPNCSVYQQCLMPFGIRFGVDTAGNLYPESQIGVAVGVATGASQIGQIFPDSGTFFIYGIQAFSAPGAVELQFVATGDLNINQLVGPADLATWNTVDCFCPVNWGCISVVSPLRLRARATAGQTLIQGLSFTLWGTKQSSVNACGPNLAVGCPPYGAQMMGPGQFG